MCLIIAQRPISYFSKWSKLFRKTGSCRERSTYVNAVFSSKRYAHSTLVQDWYLQFQCNLLIFQENTHCASCFKWTQSPWRHSMRRLNWSMLLQGPSGLLMYCSKAALEKRVTAPCWGKECTVLKGKEI